MKKQLLLLSSLILVNSIEANAIEYYIEGKTAASYINYDKRGELEEYDRFFKFDNVNTKYNFAIGIQSDYLANDLFKIGGEVFYELVDTFDYDTQCVGQCPDIPDVVSSLTDFAVYGNAKSSAWGLMVPFTFKLKEQLDYFVSVGAGMGYYKAKVNWIDKVTSMQQGSKVSEKAFMMRFGTGLLVNLSKNVGITLSGYYENFAGKELQDSYDAMLGIRITY